MAKLQKTPAELADVILGMTYHEFMEVCGSLAEMIDNDVRHKPKSAEDFASLLHDWADAQEEE